MDYRQNIGNGELSDIRIEEGWDSIPKNVNMM